MDNKKIVSQKNKIVKSSSYVSVLKKIKFTCQMSEKLELDMAASEGTKSLDLPRFVINAASDNTANNY